MSLIEADSITWKEMEEHLRGQAVKEMSQLYTKGYYDGGKYDDRVSLKVKKFLNDKSPVYGEPNSVFALVYSQTYDSPEGDRWSAALFRAMERRGTYGASYYDFKRVYETHRDNRFFHNELIDEVIDEYFAENKHKSVEVGWSTFEDDAYRFDGQKVDDIVEAIGKRPAIVIGNDAVKEVLKKNDHSAFLVFHEPRSAYGGFDIYTFEQSGKRWISRSLARRVRRACELFEKKSIKTDVELRGETDVLHIPALAHGPIHGVVVKDDKIMTITPEARKKAQKEMQEGHSYNRTYKEALKP